MRPILLAGAAVLALAACRQREEPPPPPPEAQPKAEVTEAEQAAPLTYDRETAYATVELELPEALAAYPDLHATLYGEGVAEMRRFLEGAQSDHTEYTGEDAPAPYERTVNYAPGGESARLFSLGRTAFEFTGGAHPNTTYGAVLWDKSADRRVEPAALFRTGADLTTLDRALCDAINQARTRRLGEPSALTVGGSGAFRCPRAIETPFVLAGSGEAGRAGGLRFFIGQYVVGPRVEGAYEIVVPQSAFRPLLAQAYAVEFAGQPPRTGDVTPQAPVTQAR